MSRLLYLLLFVSLSGWAAPQGRVRVSVDSEQNYWVGQRVLVHLDLMTNGFSFSGQAFDLPQIAGGALLQTDSSTTKLSETIEGESWQLLRYDLSLFSQRPGVQTIPSFTVQFSAGMGYGQAEASFELATDALTVELQMPPGADPSKPVITSSQLSVQDTWNPDQESFKVGDALTRSLVIEAEDVSAIVLPGMPQQVMPGIDLLAQSPVVEDYTDRGSLRGRRQEQVSYLFTQPGDYQLPGGIISWWDPVQKKLESFDISSRDVRVMPDPLAASSPDPEAGTAPYKLRFVLLLLVALLVLTALVFALWAKKKTTLETEAQCYKRAIRACQGHNPKLAWKAINAWLSMVGLEMQTIDTEPWQALQRAVVGDESKWNGAELAKILERMRRTKQAADHQKDVPLRPLNPSV